MSDLISRQALCEYALNQKNKNITANDIMRFPPAQPKSYREGYQAGYKDAQSETAERTAETAQNVSDSDLISRKAAIDAFDGVKVDEENCTEYDIGYNDGIDFAVSRLSVLPSAQPERKQGKWIERNPQNSDKCRLIECDQCGFSHIVGFNVPYEHWIENRNFCERCGADMREGE